MEELKNLKAFIGTLKSRDKIIIEEMIAESEGQFSNKSNTKPKRQILIDLHDQINILVIGEPSNQTFRQIKNRMDNIVSAL